MPETHRAVSQPATSTAKKTISIVASTRSVSNFAIRAWSLGAALSRIQVVARCIFSILASRLDDALGPSGVSWV